MTVNQRLILLVGGFFALITGYIVIEENTLFVEEVEVITTEYVDRITGLKLHDPSRIAELDLNEGDMPNNCNKMSA